MIQSPRQRCQHVNVVIYDVSFGIAHFKVSFVTFFEAFSLCYKSLKLQAYFRYLGYHFYLRFLTRNYLNSKTKSVNHEIQFIVIISHLNRNVLDKQPYAFARVTGYIIVTQIFNIGFAPFQNEEIESSLQKLIATNCYSYNSALL